MTPLQRVKEIRQRLHAFKHWKSVSDNPASYLESHGPDMEYLLARLQKAEDALKFGFNVMMPEIHAQRTCWPGEVDDFEDRARSYFTAYPRGEG